MPYTMGMKRLRCLPNWQNIPNLFIIKDTSRSDLGEETVDFPAVKDAIVQMGYDG